MKNAFKFGFLALAISLTVAACGETKNSTDSTDSTAVDTTLTTVDTTAKDTTAVDSTVTDTTATKVQ